MVCSPAIATTAYFVAIILLDLYNRNWSQIPGHALFGVFATLLILFICERASEGIAWILLASPLVLVFLSYLWSTSTWSSTKKEDIPDMNPDSDCIRPRCPSCSYRPCTCRRPKPPCIEPQPQPKPKPDNCIKDSLAE